MKKQNKNCEPQKEGFGPKEQSDSSIVGMDSSEMTVKFQKVDSMRKEMETIELKQQENDKSKDRNEALMEGTSQICLESSSESTIAIASSGFTPGMNTKKPSTKRYFPNWLPKALARIDRKEMANSSLSTSCELFRQLCWPKLHGDVEPHKVRLHFTSKRDESGNYQAKIQNLSEFYPIPSIPPPDYIIGFEELSFWRVDDQVLNFIRNIAHLLKNCKLETCCVVALGFWKMNKERIHALLELLADKIFAVKFNDNIMTENVFNQHFPGILSRIQSNGKPEVEDFTHIIIDFDFV